MNADILESLDAWAERALPDVVEEGACARMRGESIFACPYAPATDQRAAWMCGWEQEEQVARAMWRVRCGESVN